MLGPASEGITFSDRRTTARLIGEPESELWVKACGTFADPAVAARRIRQVWPPGPRSVIIGSFPWEEPS
jgi:hypothetical protein